MKTDMWRSSKRKVKAFCQINNVRTKQEEQTSSWSTQWKQDNLFLQQSWKCVELTGGYHSAEFQPSHLHSISENVNIKIHGFVLQLNLHW